MSVCVCVYVSSVSPVTLADCESVLGRKYGDDEV